MDASQYILKISEKLKQVELVENLPPSYLPYKFLHNLHSFLLWEKVKIFEFLKIKSQKHAYISLPPFNPTFI